MNMQENPISEEKAFKYQQYALIGVALLTLLMSLDGILGLYNTLQNFDAKISPVMTRTRWSFTIGLPVVSITCLILFILAQHKKRLFQGTSMVFCGVGAVVAIIFIAISMLFVMDTVAENYGYESCTSLDINQGVTRHGSPNTIASAWTLVGQCDSSDHQIRSGE